MEYSLPFMLFEKLSGALADINYDIDLEDSSYVPSLKELCASKLVSNASFLLKADELPITLQKLLMLAAIKSGRSLSILSLLNFWPYEKLRVPLPDIYRVWKIFLVHKLEYLTQFYADTSLILRNFIQPASKLKYLDLSAIPLIDLQISQLCSLSKSEIVTKNNPDFIIYLNCLVQQRPTLKLLCSAYRFQKTGRSRIKLIVKSLHVTPDVYCRKLVKLLHLLNPHELEQYSSDHCFHEPAEVLQILKGFHSLKALNLRQIFSPHHYKPVFDELINLERLDLRGNVIRRDLEYCLSNMYQKSHPCCSSSSSVPSSGSRLKFLNLSSCIIKNEDILYLARSPHAATLLNLNLSYVTGIIHLSSALLLLTACKNLRVLELEECLFDNRNLTPLFELLPSLEKVKYLNIGLNVTTDYMFSVAHLICDMPGLVHLRVKYFRSVLYPGPDTKTFAKEYRHLIKCVAPQKAIQVDIIEYPNKLY